MKNKKIKNTFLEEMCLDQEDEIELSNFELNSISLSNCAFIELRKERVQQFEHLTYADFSNSLIFSFETNVFQSLIHLESIDLSDNMIRTIEDNLFDKNIQLKSIDLKKNNLSLINREAFIHLSSLQVIDFSHNQIEELESFCLNSDTLKILNIGHNEIRKVSFSSFYAVPNLVSLELHYNEITQLPDTTFFRSSKLQNLTLNDNRLNEISSHILLTSVDLLNLQLQDNQITKIDYFTFLYTHNLLTVNLLNNPISHIAAQTFTATHNLQVLKITVYDEFDFSSIKDLTKLTHFHLIFKGNDQQLTFRKKFVSEYFANKHNLIELILIFNLVDIKYQSKFSDLSNLEKLHVECLYPNDERSTLHFGKQLNNMSKLKTLILKHLNYFLIAWYDKRTYFMTKYITYLDLTGMQNVEIGEFFDYFEALEYLNLSNSKIMHISPDSFKPLLNLKFLHLENTQLKRIRTVLFLFNSQLKVLNCSNSLIETIDDYSFRNLRHLEVLDLKNNRLRNVTNRTFYGLSEQTKICLEGNQCQA